MYLSQAAATVESTIVNALERSIEDEFLQIDTLRESPLLQPLERCGQLNLLQHLALLEGTFLDHVNVIHEGDAAKLLLMSLPLMPDAALTGTGIDATYGGDYFYFNNGAEERCPFRGGNWINGGNAGVFNLYLNRPRSYADWNVGGRCAFVKQQAES